MEEFFNVLVIWIVGIITGLVLHSAAGHTFGDWLKEKFHFFDSEKRNKDK